MVTKPEYYIIWTHIYKCNFITGHFNDVLWHAPLADFSPASLSSSSTLLWYWIFQIQWTQLASYWTKPVVDTGKKRENWLNAEWDQGIYYSDFSLLKGHCRLAVCSAENHVSIPAAGLPVGLILSFSGLITLSSTIMLIEM